VKKLFTSLEVSPLKSLVVASGIGVAFGFRPERSPAEPEGPSAGESRSPYKGPAGHLGFLFTGRGKQAMFEGLVRTLHVSHNVFCSLLFGALIISSLLRGFVLNRVFHHWTRRFRNGRGELLFSFHRISTDSFTGAFGPLHRPRITRPVAAFAARDKLDRDRRNDCRIRRHAPAEFGEAKSRKNGSQRCIKLVHPLGTVEFQVRPQRDFPDVLIGYALLFRAKFPPTGL